jgi:hypothetical protein
MKVLSIIGILVSGGFLIWSIIAGTSGGKISMEEFFPVCLGAAAYFLVLSIVSLVKKG